MADPELPEYLQRAQFRHAVDAYCWSMGQCLLLRHYLSRLELEDALTDVTMTEESEVRDGGGVRRSGTAKRIEAVTETVRRYEVHAANLRSKLGLDPASAAKLGRNLSAAQVDIAKLMAELAKGDK